MKKFVWSPDGKHFKGRRKKPHWRILRKRKRKAQRAARKVLRARLGRRYPR